MLWSSLHDVQLRLDNADAYTVSIYWLCPRARIYVPGGCKRPVSHIVTRDCSRDYTREKWHVPFGDKKFPTIEYMYITVGLNACLKAEPVECGCDLFCLKPYEKFRNCNMVYTRNNIPISLDEIFSIYSE